MTDLCKPATVVLLMLCIQGCAPISAADCSVREGPHKTMSARVTLTNNTSKTMTHEGVLISTDGSIVEYEFADTLLPHETRYHLIGTEYLEKIPPNLPLPASAIKTLNRPIFTLAQHLGKVRTCWARIVQYSDGSYWEVSPL